MTDARAPRARRIGLLGGSFDPPHLAHLALGRVAREALQLDELRWLPAGAPWQKADRGMAAPEHRLAMLGLLLQGEPGCVIDRRELDRTGPTYTLDTVRALQAEAEAEAGAGQGAAPALPAEWFLILGQDQYARFDTWHGWRELLGRVQLAVAAREGLTTVQPPPALAAVPHRCTVLPLPRHDISASDIRARRARGELIDLLVGPAVARYIDQHHLYEAARG